MSYISDYKVGAISEEEYRIEAAKENAMARAEELEMLESYDLCFGTGFYDNDDCELCPHKSECSGYEGDD